MSCPLAVLRPLLFWATHSYTPASSGRKYGISRTPLEWLILILPGSGFPSALLHEMDGTGLWKSQQKVTDTAREKKLSGCCVNVMEGGHLLSQSKALQPHRGSLGDVKSVGEAYLNLRLVFSHHSCMRDKEASFHTFIY